MTTSIQLRGLPRHPFSVAGLAFDGASFARRSRAEGSSMGHFLPDFAGPSGSASLGRRSPPASCSAATPSNVHISICRVSASPMPSTSEVLDELSTAAFDDAQIFFTETANDCSDLH